MNRTEKQQLIDDLHAEFGKSPHAILVDFRGLGVNAATEFRRKVRAVGLELPGGQELPGVARRQGHAPREARPALRRHHRRRLHRARPRGPGQGPRRLLKDHPQIKLKGGLVSGSQVLDAEGVKALSTMPEPARAAREAPGSPQAPASKLVRLLATPATQMARVLKAHQDKLEGK